MIYVSCHCYRKTYILHSYIIFVIIIYAFFNNNIKKLIEEHAYYTFIIITYTLFIYIYYLGTYILYWFWVVAYYTLFNKKYINNKSKNIYYYYIYRAASKNIYCKIMYGVWFCEKKKNVKSEKIKMRCPLSEKQQSSKTISRI